jgi:hypothetical protein
MGESGREGRGKVVDMEKEKHQEMVRSSVSIIVM